MAAALSLCLSACQSAPQSGEKSPSDRDALICRDLLLTGEKAFAGGNIELAQKCFSEAMREAEAKNNQTNMALAYDDMALIAAIDPETKRKVRSKIPNAINYQKRAIAIEEKLYGKDSAYVAYDLNNLGAWLGANGQYKEGEEVLRRALAIREKSPGENNLPLAFSLVNLGDNLVNQKRFSEALELLKKSASIYQANDKGGEASRVLSDIADLYQKQGDEKTADSYLAQALVLREKTFGKEHMMVAETLNNLAVSQMRQKNFEEAEPLFARALTIVQKDGDKQIEGEVSAALHLCRQKLGK